MANPLKGKDDTPTLPATLSLPRPGDFPVGSVQSRAAARARLKYHDDQKRLEEAAKLGDLNPLEQATIEGVKEPGVRVLLVKFSRLAQETAKIYGFPLPTPEQIRHNRRVAAAIDQMTGGQSAYLSLSNMFEWNRLKRIAEEQFKEEDRQSSKRP